MQADLLMVIIGLGVALFGGYYVARKADAVEPVRGSGLPQALHYIASAATAGLPAAFWFALFVTILTSDNILDEFAKYAVANLVVIIAALAALAVIEPDAPATTRELPPPD